MKTKITFVDQTTNKIITNVKISKTQPPKNPTNKTFPIDFVIGDSIAAGLASYVIPGVVRNLSYGIKSTDARGISKVGATPKEILGFLTEIDSNKLLNKRILLSSGYSNGPTQKLKIKDQLIYLKGLGCNILLVGATTDPPQNLMVLSDANEQLNLIATEYGVIFLGGFTPSKDRIHPLSYKEYYNNNVLPYEK